MFGALVYSRDRDLTAATAQDPAAATRHDEQLLYAQELLAGLLNRAAVLKEGAYWLAFERHFEAAEKAGEYQLALENLAGAVAIFLEDCDEARLRAKRARLVNTDSQTKGLVETGCVESDEDLAAIGGALVPESWG